MAFINRRMDLEGVAEGLIAGTAAFVAASQALPEANSLVANISTGSFDQLFLNAAATAGLDFFSISSAYAGYQVGSSHAISQGIVRGARAGLRVFETLDRFLAEGYNRVRGRRPHQEIDSGSRYLLRSSGLLAIVLASALAYSQVTAPKPVGSSTQASTHFPASNSADAPVGASPTPEQTKIPQAPLPTTTPIPSLDEMKKNFVLRVLYGEGGRYDPETIKARGFSITNYNNSYLQHIINILNVIDNRSKPENRGIFPLWTDMVKAALSPGEFSVVHWPGNEPLYFKAPLPNGFMNLPTDELLRYLNTSPISDEEITKRWSDGQPLNVSLAKEKRAIVERAYRVYMGQGIEELVDSGILQPTLPSEVLFYKNTPNSPGVLWDGRCQGPYMLSYFRSDPEAIRDGFKHDFYAITGPCKNQASTGR